MKNILKNIIIIFILFLHANSYGQQMIQKINDTFKLEENKDQFINRPLKELLKEIKPEIKTGIIFNNEKSSLFVFRFATLAQQRQREGSVIDRLSLLVFVKQYIPWNWEERPKGSELNWTTNDAQNYADFIILDIGVVPSSEN